MKRVVIAEAEAVDRDLLPAFGGVAATGVAIAVLGTILKAAGYCSVSGRALIIVERAVVRQSSIVAERNVLELDGDQPGSYPHSRSRNTTNEDRAAAMLAFGYVCWRMARAEHVDHLVSGWVDTFTVLLGQQVRAAPATLVPIPSG